MGSSLEDLAAMPDEVKRDIGYALHFAQRGEKHDDAKPLVGFGGASVLEIVERFDGNAYRAVYTVRFESAVYVLHVFQKRSTKGIATPKHDLELIRSRLRQAEIHYLANYGGKG